MRPPLPQRLVVPAVERGDIGLVLTVASVRWDSNYRHWAVTVSSGHRYVLPERLYEWARGLDFDVRRHLVDLPVAVAFARYGGAMAARTLSASRNV